MVEAHPQNVPTVARKGATVVVPIPIGSPTASETRRRRPRESRIMSTTSSMMSAAAAGIPCPEKNKISWVNSSERKDNRILSGLICYGFLSPHRNNEALMHIVKATIGGGFLSMPEAFNNAGLIVGIVGTMILGMSVLNMMSVIVSVSHITLHTYNDILVYSYMS